MDSPNPTPNKGILEAQFILELLSQNNRNIIRHPFIQSVHLCKQTEYLPNLPMHKANFNSKSFPVCPEVIPDVPFYTNCICFWLFSHAIFIWDILGFSKVSCSLRIPLECIGRILSWPPYLNSGLAVYLWNGRVQHMFNMKKIGNVFLVLFSRQTFFIYHFKYIF